MRRLAKQIWNLVRRLKQKPSAQPFRRRCRLDMESLEERVIPSATGFPNPAPAVLTGLVYVDVNNNNIRDPNELTVPGARVTLKGGSIDVTATTNARGQFTFFQVPVGTYTLILDSSSLFIPGRGHFGNLGGSIGKDSVSSITVAEGQTGINYNLGVRGESSSSASLRDLQSSFTPATDASFSPAGTGSTAADHTLQPKARAAKGTAVLSGAVKNGSSGLGGVEVTLSGIDDTGRDIFQTTKTVTGNTGFYQFTGLQPGAYTLNVPIQPGGFRADLPSVGSLGGLVLRNDQITHISVATGTSGTEYDFAEVALLKPATHAGPQIIAQLADDTAGAPFTNVASGSSNTVTITFQLPGPQNTMTADGTKLTGTNPTVSVATTTAGILPSTVAVQTITFGGTITGGTFTLTFNNITTAPITWSGTAASLVANIQAALNEISAQDNITSDPSIVGSVTSSSALTGLSARFTGQFVDIFAQVGKDGQFFLNPDLLKQINGGTLPDGAYTLHLKASDAAGKVTTFDMPAFTLDTTAPTEPTLQIENPQPMVTSGPGTGDFTVTFGYTGAQSTMSADGTKLTGSGAGVQVATTTPGTDSTAAVQTITFNSMVTGGTFTLKFNNVTSSPITWSADTATLQTNIQSALNALLGGNVDSNNKATIGGTTSAGAHVLLIQGTPHVASVTSNSVSVTFPFPGPENAMTADSTSLTGTSPTIAVSTTTSGALPATAAVQTITFGGTVTGGTFKLTFNSMTTGPITWSATASVLVANIQAALNGIIGTQSTTAAGDGTFSFNVTMSPGASKFIVQASDPAGNISQLSKFLVNPIALATPTDHTVSMSLPAVAGDTSDDQNFNLTGIFHDPNLGSSVVTFDTSAGPMSVQLQDGVAPQTVANFLNYLAQGAYNNDVFHRLDTNPQVLQGGGFTFQTNPSSIVPVSVNPAIQNEFSTSNPDVAGTIAMAKQGGNPNSATSQFFFNLADNSTTLGASNNGGFTVFGKVLSPQDQRILNTLAQFPVKNETQHVFDVKFTAPGPKPTMTATSSLKGTKPTINVATNTNGSVPIIQAVQTITFSGTITGGTFKLTLGSATTADIKWSPNNKVLADNIQKALNLLANTTVTVTSSTNPFNVFPVKNYKGSPFPANATASNFDLIKSITTQLAPTDHLTFAVTNSDPTVVQASLNANNWLLLHPLKAGTDTITVTATDQFGSSAQVSFAVSFPVALTSNFAAQTNLEGDTAPGLQAVATDSNNLPVTFTATGLPTGLTMSSSGLVSGTIANDAHGKSPYTVTVTASDSASSASQTFTWTVTPVVTMTALGDQTNHVGNSINLQVNGQDAKSKTLTFSATHLPTGLNIDSSGKIAGKITAKGTFHVTITATDGTFSNTQSFKWTVS